MVAVSMCRSSFTKSQLGLQFSCSPKQQKEEQFVQCAGHVSVPPQNHKMRRVDLNTIFLTSWSTAGSSARIDWINCCLVDKLIHNK